MRLSHIYDCTSFFFSIVLCCHLWRSECAVFNRIQRKRANRGWGWGVCLAAACEHAHASDFHASCAAGNCSPDPVAPVVAVVVAIVCTKDPEISS